MTNAPDPDPYAGQPGWGDPHGAAYDPTHWDQVTYAQVTERRRPWYKAPENLVGAATFSAVCAWVTFVCALVGYRLEVFLEGADIWETIFLGLFAAIGLAVAGAIGIAAFCLTVAGAVVTVPLAAAWFRDPRRATGPGIALVHAVVAWAAMAVTLVWALS